MSKERETLITDLSINAVDGFFYITQKLQVEIRELLKIGKIPAPVQIKGKKYYLKAEIDGLKDTILAEVRNGPKTGINLRDHFAGLAMQEKSPPPKPEQTEQEPVVWQVIGIAGFMYVYNKPIDQVYEHHTVNALYTASPKREPIEDEELEVWYSQHTWAMDKQEYMWGFRDGEKAHGIGGGE